MTRIDKMYKGKTGKTRTCNCPSACLDHMIEAIFVLVVGPAVKLQHLPLSHGLESKKLNLGSDLGPSDLGVKVKHNSMILQQAGLVGSLKP